MSERAMGAELLVVDAVPAASLDALEADFVAHKLWLATDRSALLRRVGNRVRAIVTNWQTGFDAALLAALPHVEIVSVYGTGDQALDLPAAKARRITVVNTQQDGTDAAVADLTLGFILVLARRIMEADCFVRAGHWRSAAFAPTTDLSGKTVGIVGLGYIGSQIARRAKAFDMVVCYHDVAAIPNVAYAFCPDLVDMASEADFMVVSCRGGPEANGMINARVLDALGPKGFLIHVAQARFYDEPALIAALRGRRIAGAAIDIFPDEPGIHAAYYDLDNVILSPHVGAITRELLDRRAAIVVRNIKDHFAGRPLSARLA